MKNRFQPYARGLTGPLLAASALGLALACGPGDGTPPAAAGRPSFLLVTLDTTRADRIGAYGYRAARTPSLDRLAAEGLLFSQARTTSPLTLPAHASILTGTHPREHGVRDNAVFVLAPEAHSIAEALQRAGWHTGAFIASDVLGRRFGLDQGFDVYDDVQDSSRAGARLERPAGEVVQAALQWLSGLPPGEPWFAWVHLYDPHRNWHAPEPFTSQLADAYDAEIAYADAELGRLLAALAEQRPQEHRLVLVTADHGESLGEHGEDSHGVFLYEAVARVPLIVAGSALRAPPGTRSDAPVSNADIAATVAEMAGLGPGGLPGASLPALLDTAAGRPRPGDPGRPLLLESFGPYFSYRWHALRAVVEGRYKWIEGARGELFDIVSDPLEATDLAAQQPERAAALRARLAALEAAWPARAWSEAREVAASERAQLAELGYVAGDRGGDPLDAALPDPRDRIGLIGLVAAAQSELEAWEELQIPLPDATPAQASERLARADSHLRAARDRMREAFEIGPDSPFVQAQLGSLEAALGHYASAIPLLEAAVAGRPGEASLHFDLAVARDGAGLGSEAIASAQRAVSLEPDSAAFRQLLVLLLEKQGRLEDALAALAEFESRAGGDVEALSWVSSRRAQFEERLRQRAGEP